MEDRQRTLAAVTILIGLVVFAVIIIVVLVGGNKVVSPVPDEGAIKIIFITPTLPAVATPTATLAPTVTPKPIIKKASPTPTKSSTDAATLVPTP